jgi:hypothetical protein
MEIEYKEESIKNKNLYEYLIEKYASKLYKLPENITKINLLCYTINSNIIFPFLLFLLFKDEDNILKFPIIEINNDEPFENMINEYFNKYFNYFDISYNGIICNNNIYFLMIEIKIKNNFLDFSEQYPNIYFSLSSEIINYKKINNYLIDKNITQMFLNIPEFGILYDKNNKINYKIPDVAYKIISHEQLNYFLFFQNKKENNFNLINDYYFFYRKLKINENENDNKSENENKKYIFRYALFCGNKLRFEMNDTISITDFEINELLKFDTYKTLYILHTMSDLPDILAINENNFTLLTYYNL